MKATAPAARAPPKGRARTSRAASSSRGAHGVLESLVSSPSASSPSGSSWSTARAPRAPASGADDPAYYLKRQALYAFVGVVVLALLARVDFRALRQAPPGPLLLASLVLLVAVLAVGTTVNGARAGSGRPGSASSPLSSRRSRSPSGSPPTSRAAPAPRTLGELLRPIGLVVGLARRCSCSPSPTSAPRSRSRSWSPRCSSSPARRSALARRRGRDRPRRARPRHRLEPYRRARLLTFLDPLGRPSGRRLPDRPGHDRARLRRACSASASARASRRSTTSPRPRRT